MPKEVNWTGFLPSLSQAQISLLPVRADMKAIRFPSGEYCGELSARVEAIHFAGAVLFRGADPEIRHTSVSLIDR
jgi:hypothetical protein